LGSGLEAGGTEPVEGFEGALMRALEGIEAALEAVHLFGFTVEGLGQRNIRIFEGAPVEVLKLGFPDLGFGLAEAAEEPLGGDHVIDLVALFGEEGLEALVVLGGEGFEIGEVLAADDHGFGVDAGFQGILGSTLFALDGAGASGFLGVEAVGLDLMDGRHNVNSDHTVARRQGGSGGRRGEAV